LNSHDFAFCLSYSITLYLIIIARPAYFDVLYNRFLTEPKPYRVRSSRSCY